MIPPATACFPAWVVSRWKPFLLIALLCGLAGCSQQTPPPASAGMAKAGGLQKYYPLFAVVKIPDSFMQQQGVSHHETNGWDFGSLENRAKVAAYVLAHPGEFSFTQPAGNFVPVVWSHKQTSIELRLDPRQEERDLEKYGMKTTAFEASVDVGDEDEHGNVQCSWWYGYGVHTKEPVGGSSDRGGTGPLGGGIYPVGQPDMAELYHGPDAALWLVVELNRK